MKLNFATIALLASFQSAPASKVSDVKQLVEASNKLQVAPPEVLPLLKYALYVTAGAQGKKFQNCWSFSSLVKKCVLGRANSKTTLVAIGDSHAAMWSPALDFTARHLGMKLVLMWHPWCPQVATPKKPECTAWKKNAYDVAKRLKPRAIFIAERTTFTTTNDDAKQWITDLQKSLLDLSNRTGTVVVLGDTPVLTQDPASCVAANPKAVQRCSVSRDGFPGSIPSKAKSERIAASRVRNAVFIDPTPWLCAQRCSPIIGKMIAYSDGSHISTTYVKFLSKVMSHSVESALSRKP